MTDQEFLSIGKNAVCVQRMAAGKLAALTRAELHCLALIATGLTIHEAAAVCGRSHKTVEGHLARVRKRLKISTVEAIVLAVKAGMV
jgi:DNA-binding CsgD family transcriptional regulator